VNGVAIHSQRSGITGMNGKCKTTGDDENDDPLH
jgi:hypothetical protein